MIKYMNKILDLNKENLLEGSLTPFFKKYKHYKFIVKILTKNKILFEENNLSQKACLVAS